jgi:DTW domain-containing protein YfiP
MPREMCYRCFRPSVACLCAAIEPMATRTRFVLLMHPKEWKEEKAATGRLTHLCLANSVVHMGVDFDGHEAVQALIRDTANRCCLLFPGRNALNLSAGERPLEPTDPRRLVVFVVDATWSLGRKMLRVSPSLQALPRIMFTPAGPSRFVIKQQPHPGCLSTIESVHEVLLALERSNLDRYECPGQLLSLFDRMQEFQIRCASDPTRGGYRRRAYSPPGERTPPQGRSGRRRMAVFRAPG